MSNDLSLSDFCVPAKEMKFSQDKDTKSEEMLQEFLKDQRALVNLMLNMKTGWHTNIVTRSSLLSERVKNILQQKGYSLTCSDGWTSIKW